MCSSCTGGMKLAPKSGAKKSSNQAQHRPLGYNRGGAAQFGSPRIKSSGISFSPKGR